MLVYILRRLASAISVVLVTVSYTHLIKYQDGTEVKAEDYAYAIKRSFAHDLFADGPTYQLDYFKDGDTYKGPWASGDTYAGVETPDNNTLVIHLRTPFADLPFYASFPMFTPIPKAKDTKDNYQNSPMATGPYTWDTYTVGTELKLKKNPNWDPNTDPVRHQYADAWDFKWGSDGITTQKQTILSQGPDASSIEYLSLIHICGSDVDAALHYLARMLEAGEDPRFIARRVVIAASEDVGMADPSALQTAVAALHAVAQIGMPEARIVLAQAVVHVAIAPKSNAAYLAVDAAIADLRAGRGGLVPAHLRGSGYAGAARLGHGAGYRYPHDEEEGVSAQQYLPDDLAGRTDYYRPSGRGFEERLVSRWAWLKEQIRRPGPG